MKLATYLHEGRESFGVLLDCGICDMPSLMPQGPGSLLEALQAGPELLAELEKRAESFPTCTPQERTTLLAPIPRPPKVLGVAVNYVAHHDELDRGKALPDDPKQRTTPRPFLMPSTVVATPGAEIPWPVFSEQIDYEIELAAVIGTRASRISPEEAPAIIAGYTIANDISARSVTHAAGREERPKDGFFDWLHGKWADGFLPLGPWLVTADEIGDPHSLAIELKVNGKTRQQAETSLMIFNVFELVAFCSQLMTLEPGDVIATGTPSGVGAATGDFLAPGDRLTCRIERIGELTNTLGKKPETFYRPCAKA